MSRICVMPHRSTAEGVDAGAWTVGGGGLDARQPGVLAGWDHLTPVELRSEVRIDVDRVRAACGLVASDALLLVATWHSTGTNIRGVGARSPIERSASYPISFVIDPTLAAGHVTLVRCIALAEPGTSDDLLAARRTGAVLWRETPRAATTVALDGAGVRFSTEALDFGRPDDGEAGAAWQLDVDLSDLQASPSGSLRLSVNTSHPAIDQLLADVDDDSMEATESVLRWDVARQLIERALDSDDFVQGFGEFPPDTVGGTVQDLFERWLTGARPSELRALRASDRPRFEALLQDRLRLLQAP